MSDEVVGRTQMPAKERSSSSRSEDGDNGGGDTPQLGRNPDADPVQIHRDYVERRIGGGAPPTSDAYARALEEFHKMPGAVRRPASEATGETARERSARPAPWETEDVEIQESGPERAAWGEAADTGGAWEAER